MKKMILLGTSIIDAKNKNNHNKGHVELIVKHVFPVVFG